MGTRRLNLEVFFRRTFMRDAYEGLLAYSDLPNYTLKRKILLTYDMGAFNDERDRIERYKIHARNIMPGLTDLELETRYRSSKRDILNAGQHDVVFTPKPSLFNLVLGYARHTLRMDMEEPLCQYRELLHWQDSTHIHGQDLFTCAAYAYNELAGLRTPKNLAWPAIIRTDNFDLRHLLTEESGIAENHFHLWVSTCSFDITWSLCMNHPARLVETLREARLYEQLGGDYPEWFPEDNHEEHWYTWICRASAIRAELFRYCHGGENIEHNLDAAEDQRHGSDSGRVQGQKRRRHGLDVIRDMEEHPYNLTALIQTLREDYGARLREYDSVIGSDVYDYAFTRYVAWDTADNSNRALVGERNFLIKCFKQVFVEDCHECFDDQYKQMFYLYLLIKAHFRGEFVQSNNRPGFDNFSRYQERKSAPGKAYPYNCEMAHFAINATIDTQPISSLELRITPAETADACAKKLGDIIRCQLKPKLEAQVIDNPENSEVYDKLFGVLCGGLELSALKYFFVWHFPKRRDAFAHSASENITDCHNRSTRRQCGRWARAIAESLDKYPLTRTIVRGIDGCSEEIGCRPEVMAHAFRYLSNYIPKDDPTLAFFHGKLPETHLRRTFHVGEDFLDLTDGIRAIDEAMFFLDLRRGDRIGHAVALGLDPALYYFKRGNRIILNKQDMADTLVWLLHRAPEWDIPIPLDLRIQLEREFMKLVRDIYAVSDKDFEYAMGDKDIETEITLDTYFRAWHLRGDAPEYYNMGYESMRKISGDETLLILNPFEYYAFSRHKYVEKVCRPCEKAFRIYWRYHYSVGVRKRGAEIYEICLPNTFVELVQGIQDKMRSRVFQKGIAIETNPTSNKLISNFQRYDEHPIFKFYNRRLTDAELGEQLSVSINTDDQGVFTTSIENEYALIVSALEHLRDETGRQKYNFERISSYVRDIRRMGHRQSFMKECVPKKSNLFYNPEDGA